MHYWCEILCSQTKSNILNAKNSKKRIDRWMENVGRHVYINRPFGRLIERGGGGGAPVSRPTNLHAENLEDTFSSRIHGFYSPTKFSHIPFLFFI